MSSETDDLIPEDFTNDAELDAMLAEAALFAGTFLAEADFLSSDFDTSLASATAFTSLSDDARHSQALADRSEQSEDLYSFILSEEIPLPTIEKSIGSQFEDDNDDDFFLKEFLTESANPELEMMRSTNFLCVGELDCYLDQLERERNLQTYDHDAWLVEEEVSLAAEADLIKELDLENSPTTDLSLMTPTEISDMAVTVADERAGAIEEAVEETIIRLTAEENLREKLRMEAEKRRQAAEEARRRQEERRLKELADRKAREAEQRTQRERLAEQRRIAIERARLTALRKRPYQQHDVVLSDPPNGFVVPALSSIIQKKQLYQEFSTISLSDALRPFTKQFAPVTPPPLPLYQQRKDELNDTLVEQLLIISSSNLDFSTSCIRGWCLSQQFISVEKINISHAGLSTLGFSAAFPRLKHLTVSSCNISSLDGLFAPSLSVLDISGNLLDTLTGLEGAQVLRVLKAGQNALADVSALLNCQQLQYIDLSHNPIQSFHGIELCSVMHLDLCGCGSLDLIPLCNSPSLALLRTLHLSHTKHNLFSSLESNPASPFLRVLTMNDCGASQFTFGAYPLLKTISVCNNGLADIFGLPSLPSLDSLFITDNRLNWYSLVQDLPFLTNLRFFACSNNLHLPESEHLLVSAAKAFLPKLKFLNYCEIAGEEALIGSMMYVNSSSRLAVAFAPDILDVPTAKPMSVSLFTEEVDEVITSERSVAFAYSFCSALSTKVRREAAITIGFHYRLFRRHRAARILAAWITKRKRIKDSNHERKTVRQQRAVTTISQAWKTYQIRKRGKKLLEIDSFEFELEDIPDFGSHASLGALDDIFGTVSADMSKLEALRSAIDEAERAATAARTALPLGPPPDTPEFIHPYSARSALSDAEWSGTDQPFSPEPHPLRLRPLANPVSDVDVESIAESEPYQTETSPAAIGPPQSRSSSSANGDISDELAKEWVKHTKRHKKRSKKLERTKKLHNPVQRYERLQRVVQKQGRPIPDGHRLSEPLSARLQRMPSATETPVRHHRSHDPLRVGRRAVEFHDVFLDGK